MIFRKFWDSRRGNFAMMFGLAIIPVLLAAGMAVDYSRSLQAKTHLQDLADAASLALASANIQEEAKLKAFAEKYVLANFDGSIVDEVAVGDVSLKDDAYDVEVRGKLHTYFMSIASIDELNVNTSALAIRGINGSVEVALVLDNTWSMSDTDSSGVKKIDALKSAARELVTSLHKNSDASVRISVVPYADYVNVGVSNRNKSWVSVPEDTSSTSERKCEKRTTKSECKRYEAKSTCYRTVDGVEEAYSCGGGCAEWREYTVPEYEVCWGGGTTVKTWYGCVGSRKSGKLRLSDESPAIPYPGFIDTKQLCPNELLPLTGDKDKPLTAIDGMFVEKNGYRPLTYIPAGLIWGLNVLSPKAPFAEGAAYDPKNVSPRKVIVLMTDGENTMRFRASNGSHTAFNTSGNGVPSPGQVKQTRDDTLALCKNIKDQKIEIFSVAFGVDSADSKSLLETCATDKDHYFDAADSAALSQAFSEIVTALTSIRLAR